MKFLAGVSLATAASAAVIDVAKRDASPLSVTLEKVGNSQVKAVVTNSGNEDLKVFKTGTFLDEAAVEKVEVFQGTEKVQFDGLRVRLAMNDLPEEAFEVISAGGSVEATFDVATMHDLSQGGAFDIVSKSGFLTASINSTSIDGAVAYSSNTLKAEVDGAEAALSRTAFLSKRTSVQSDCTGSRGTAIRSALSNCASLARNAASAASSGSAAKMTEYFKSSSSSARSTVAGVFNRVASECGSTSGGVSRTYCSDVYGACSGGVLAYTLPSASYMAYCPLAFNQLPLLSRTCHAQDLSTTVLHEATHLRQIKGTEDYGGYGYNFVRSLSGSQNLNHADTYTLFANAIYVGC